MLQSMGLKTVVFVVYMCVCMWMCPVVEHWVLDTSVDEVYFALQ